ncbi:MAG: aminopeptidase P family protein [Anaerofustis sp.]
MDKTFYIKKRDDFFAKLPNKSLAVINSGMIQYTSLDGEYPFEVDRNFYYFTGIAMPDMKLLLAKTENRPMATLCIPRVDQTKEKWIGKFFTPDDCRSASGIDFVIFTDELDEFIFGMVNSNRIDKCFLYTDNIKTGRPQTLNNLTFRSITEKYPLIEIKDISTLTMPMRTIKTPEEVDMIKQAATITNAAVAEAVKNIKPSIYEYEVQACFEYVVKRRGGKPSFNTIAASGSNSVTLHYTANNQQMQDGELILMDCGASLGWYCADVTRTFPVNGKFTERQLQIYNIVLAANKYIISQVKPGLTTVKLNELLIEFYQKELKAIGLIAEDNEVSQYYYHGVSHSLGLDTHDVFDKNIPIEAGMVITVEPGLYIEKYGFGIRIEDDVLVTAKGCEVLTADIIKEASEIEEAMNVWEVK